MVQLGNSIFLDQINCILQLSQLELDGLNGFIHLSHGYPNISNDAGIKLVMSIYLQTSWRQDMLGFFTWQSRFQKQQENNPKQEAPYKSHFVSCFLLSHWLKQVTKLVQINLEGHYERTEVKGQENLYPYFIVYHTYTPSLGTKNCFNRSDVKALMLNPLI